MRSRFKWFAIATIVALVLPFVNVRTINAAADPADCESPKNGQFVQWFSKTCHNVEGDFLFYWTDNGDLAQFGYPLTGVFSQRLEDGKDYFVQYFERVRMEIHPELGKGKQSILLGQFGRRLHAADAAVAAKPEGNFFPQTGHNVGTKFFRYWNEHGGLNQFGFPISEELSETLEDGKVYTVQYFERARFEFHPENPAPYDVLLGQFGRKIYPTMRRQETGQGNSLHFDKGQPIIGAQIKLDNGDVFYGCFLGDPKIAGTVIDGVINPGEKEVSAVPVCDLSHPSRERKLTGEGKTLDFQKGENVLGAVIELANGQKFLGCYLENASTNGRVTSGVINPYPGEITAAKRCS